MEYPTPRGEIYAQRRPERAGGRVAYVGNGKPTNRVSYADCDAEELAAWVSIVAGNGDLACLCYTSDGGAFSVTIVSGQSRIRGYARTADELLVTLSEMREKCYG